MPSYEIIEKEKKGETRSPMGSYRERETRKVIYLTRFDGVFLFSFVGIRCVESN